MSLVFTQEDSADEAADAYSSDDEQYQMGAGVSVAGIADPSASGRWGTAHARAKASAPTKATSLDAKLAARAAKAGRSASDQPELADTALDEGVQERRQTKKVKKAKAAAAEAAEEAAPAVVAADEDEEGADEPLTEPSSAATNFSSLALSKPLLKAVSELGFTAPTPIQAAVMPPALRGVDVCASAVTGSGKTAAFLLPALERLMHRPRRITATRVLVLCPTRELAAQCEEMGRHLGRFTDVRFSLIVGGLSLKGQEADLRSRPDIVVATPGRLIDLLRNAPSVSLDELEILVLDEADRLLELGFQKEVEEVVRACPRSRQTMLFSATITASVATLANLSLNAPLQVKVDPLFNVATKLRQEFVRLRPSKEHEREAVLLSLVTRTFLKRAIIFLSSKKHAHRIKIIFGLLGLRAAELHGNLTQLQRLQALDDFRDGKADFLLATDLAGRGLDIKGVQTVINYELPTEHKTYVHRVGRTARAGSDGRAVSLVTERDRAFLKQVLKHARDVVCTRTVPPESVAHWVNRLSDLESEISAVMREEAEEKALRVTEMELHKASNLMEHRDEIMSRPARSWFQTSKERQALKDEARLQQPTAGGAPTDTASEGGAKKRASAELDPPKKVKRDKYAGLTRKQRRARQRTEAFAADVDEDGGGGIAMPNQKAAAKSAKSAKRRMKLGPSAGGDEKRRKLQHDAPGDAGGGSRNKEPRAPKAPKAERPKGRADKAPKKMRAHSKPKYAKARKRR